MTDRGTDSREAQERVSTTHAKVTQQDDRDKAIEYYRAGVESRPPKWLPCRIRLDGPVRGDYPIGHRTIAEAGDHDCESNRYGAVSVRATNGQMLGIKPAEFEALAWRLNVSKAGLRASSDSEFYERGKDFSGCDI